MIMSNQNFDANSQIPSSSQPIPIAQQLEAQAYLLQVQNQRMKMINAEEVSIPAPIRSQILKQSAPVEQPRTRDNKMDAFFLRAEEEERQRLLASQNSTPPTADQAEDAQAIEPAQPAQAEAEGHSFDAVANLQTPQSFQQNETPVIELPQVEVTPEAAAAAPETVPSSQFNDAEQLENVELDEASALAPTPQSPSPFAAESFVEGPAGLDPITEGPSQFSTQQYLPAEATDLPPSQDGDWQASPQPPNFLPKDESPEPTGVVEPSGSVEPMESDDLTDESAQRRLTGAAGLAAAGMSAFAFLKQGEPSSHADPQPDDDRNNDNGGITGDASTFQENTPLNPAQADAFGGVNAPSAWTQQDASAGSDPLPSTSQNTFSNPQPIPTSVTSGLPQDFDAPQQPAAESALVEDHEQDVHSDYTPPNAPQPNNELPNDQLPGDVPSMLPQDAAGLALPTPPSSDVIEDADAEMVNVEIEHAEDAKDENSEDEDLRAEAERQALRIKAQRAKELVDGPTAPARPYGAAASGIGTAENQQAALANLPEFSTTAAAQVGIEGAPQPAVTAAAPSFQSAPTNSDAGHEEGGRSNTRPFPMELFNCKLLRNLRSGVVFVDHQRRVQLWSKGAEKMTGIVSDAVIERPLYPQTFNLRFEDGTGVPLSKCPIVQCLETMENVTADYRTLNAENQEVKIEVAITPVIDNDRFLNGAILIFNDHTVEIDLQRQLKDLYEFSVLDPLTQVANRAEFERVLEEYVRAFNQSESFHCSIIICDIDFFKSINDNFGHAIGDQALVAFSEMLRKYVRSQDLVARYGGEEFVILCADCDTDAALQRAEEIRIGLFKTPQKMLDGKSISASFGVSELRKGDTAMEFFVRADTALLKAKELGRNRVVIADQREANRHVNITEEDSISGMQWRQQRREHTALICEEFKTSTPVPVLVEKLRGFIIEKDAWLQRVDQEFLSMEVDFEAPQDYSRKGNFTMNIEFKEADESEGGRTSKKTFIRVTIFPGRKKKWFSTNHTDVAPHLLSDLRSYLMINDEASHLSVKMATENVRDK